MELITDTISIEKGIYRGLEDRCSLLKNTFRVKPLDLWIHYVDTNDVHLTYIFLSN